MSAGTAPTRGLLERLQHLDRRWLFLVMGLAVVIPILLPIGLPVTPGGGVVDTFDAIDAIKPGDRVFVSFDFDPASTPELEPFAKSTLFQLKKKRARIIMVTLWPYSPPLIDKYIDEILRKPVGDGHTGDEKAALDKVYERKTDYIFLGYKEGKSAIISLLGESISTAFPTSYQGEPVGTLPIMQGIKSLQDFKSQGIIVLISAGQPGAKEYVEQLSRHGLPMVAACTAVSRTDLQPYYSSGQLLGLVAGMQGSAEFESMVKPSGIRLGERGLDVLNVGTLVIIGAIILGNLIYFAEKRRTRGAA